MPEVEGVGNEADENGRLRRKHTAYKRGAGFASSDDQRGAQAGSEGGEPGNGVEEEKEIAANKIKAAPKIVDTLRLQSSGDFGEES